MSALVGSPVALFLDVLPASFRRVMTNVVRDSLAKAMHLVAGSMGAKQSRPFRKLHSSIAMAAGAAGGAFGAPALAVELPFTTCVMLRSIADIARAEGEDLNDPETRVACMEVFAFGAPGGGVDSAGLGYFAVRQALAREAERVAQILAVGALRDETAPVVLRFLEVVASRFGLVVGEKAAAQFLPVVGALGGATINLLFMRHFQAMAAGHFTVRRLERLYGADAVREQYQMLKDGA